MSDQKIFLLPNNVKVEFSANVILHFIRNAQLPKNKKNVEVGGQLFSLNPHESHIIIDTATGPYASDKSSKYFWKPDAKQMSSDRKNLFCKSLYVVGLWHTHPEAYPQSSAQDKITSLKHLNLLDKTYQGFLLITVGFKELSVEYLEKSTKKWYLLKEILHDK